MPRRETRSLWRGMCLMLWYETSPKRHSRESTRSKKRDRKNSDIDQTAEQQRRLLIGRGIFREAAGQFVFQRFYMWTSRLWHSLTLNKTNAEAAARHLYMHSSILPLHLEGILHREQTGPPWFCSRKLTGTVCSTWTHAKALGAVRVWVMVIWL